MRSFLSAAPPFFFLVLTAHAASTCPTAPKLDELIKTFESDFRKAATLDLTQWRPYVGQTDGLDKANYVRLPSQLLLGGGQPLRIEVDRREEMEHPFVSGQITSQGRFAQTYGHFEMRAKFAEANGMHSTFWLLPENGRWPPEIDIAEYVHHPDHHGGSKPMASPETTLHAAIPGNAVGSEGSENAALFAELRRKSSDGFHIYALDWRPQSVVFSIDGQVAYCVVDDGRPSTQPPHTPMYMLIDTAVSSGSSTHVKWDGFVDPQQKFPVVTLIDYVHVYQFRDIAAAPVLAVDLRNVQLSRRLLGPGEALKVTGDIVVGAADLATLSLTMNLNSFADPSNFQYGKWQAQLFKKTFADLKKGQTYSFAFDYKLPEDAAPGYRALTASFVLPDGMEQADKNSTSAHWNQPQVDVFEVGKRD